MLELEDSCACALVQEVTYHCQSADQLGWRVVLSCGDPIDEVGTEPNDCNQRRKLECPHGREGNAHGA